MRNFSAGIHVLVKKENVYLIIRRSANDVVEPGYWDLPGGAIDTNEQPMDAAIRESKEEANIEINNLKVVDVFAFTNYDGQWSIETVAVADYVSGSVKLSHEHSEYKWVSKEELLELQLQGTFVKKIIPYL